MRDFIKWAFRVLFLMLIVVCVDMNLNERKLAKDNQKILVIINILTGAILALMILRIYTSKKTPN